MDQIELEGGMPMVPSVPPMAPEDKGNPVTMNVSMNASGKDHVADLLDMMKNAGMAGAGELPAAGLPMRTDMEKLRGIVDGPKDMDDLKPGMQDEPCDVCGKQHVGASSCNDDIDMDDEASTEDYANEPDEEYKAIDDVINSGDDLHRSKDAYAATQDGDNPMAVEDGEDATTYSVKGKSAEAQAALADAAGDTSNIKEKLAARLKELMADGYDEDEEVEDCPECGEAGKKKLMACGSCGCS